MSDDFAKFLFLGAMVLAVLVSKRGAVYEEAGKFPNSRLAASVSGSAEESPAATSPAPLFVLEPPSTAKNDEYAAENGADARGAGSEAVAPDGDGSGGEKSSGLPELVKFSETLIPDPASLSWRQAKPDAIWSPRDSHIAFVWNGKIWVMGGLDANDLPKNGGAVEYWRAKYFNDIWNSDDGFHWHLAAEKSSWPPRRSMSVVFFKDKLWMFGGWSPVGGYQSDIWASDDGINWTLAAREAAWAPREGQVALVFQNKIWMFGGVNYDKRKTLNDVWYSEDGVNWSEAPSAPWHTRWDHAVEVFHGKLWLTAGMDLGGKVFRDEWVSDDGMSWTLVTDKPPWRERQGHALVVLGDKLWLVGRLDDPADGGTNDIWYSEDGVDWEKTRSDPGWTGREDHGVVVFRNKIWVLGGMDSSWRWRNDVWYSVPDANSFGGAELSAGSALAVVFGGNGNEKVVFEKNPAAERPLASITKLLTAIVASEVYSGGERILMTEGALSNKGSSGKFRPGEVFTASGLIHAMLVESNNDAAEALASGKGQAEFVGLMNKKAKLLGLKDFNFANPSGLDPSFGPPNYSTAEDLAGLLEKIAVDYPAILKITSLPSYDLYDAEGGFHHRAETTDVLLLEKTPLEILGGKTGETPLAEKNLVLVVKISETKRAVVVILGSDDSFGDARILLERLASGLGRRG